MEPFAYSFYEKVLASVEEMPNKSLYADETRDYSTKDFYYASVEAANFLAKNNVRKGDLVFLRSPRCIDTFILFVALSFLGAVTALSDPHQGVLEAAKTYELESQTRFALTNESGGDDVSACGNWELWDLKENRKIPCPISLGKEAVAPCFDPSVDIYAPSFVIFTSGSSQKAKAVANSQYTFINHIEKQLESSSGTPEDCILMLLPIHHQR